MQIYSLKEFEIIEKARKFLIKNSHNAPLARWNNPTLWKQWCNAVKVIELFKFSSFNEWTCMRRFCWDYNEKLAHGRHYITAGRAYK
jgi:hypothetical protein